MVKNKLSMASALIWKEEVVTEENLGNIKSQDSLHATGPDTRGENSASLTGVRVDAGVEETGSYSLSCAALPGTMASVLASQKALPPTPRGGGGWPLGHPP